MKNSALFLVLVFSLCAKTIVLGQQNKIDIGIVGGPNSCRLTGNDIVEKYTDKATRYVLGANFQYNFPKIVSIITGLNYERKGAAAKITFTDAQGQYIGTSKFSFNMDYLVVPLQIKATLGKKLKFFLGAGGYLAYLIDASEKSSSSDMQEYHKKTENLNKMDVGVITSMGVSLPITNKFSISLTGSYNIGLYNIASGPVYLDQALNTRSTNLLLGVSYKLCSRKM